MELRKITKEFIPQALTKAYEYLWMNHPNTSESICRDVLEADEENQEALKLLIQSITEQFDNPRKYNVKVRHARELIPRVKDEYWRFYLSGLVMERWARSKVMNLPGEDLHDYIQEAMDCFEKAAQIRPKHDESSLLHWNLCVRWIESHPHVKPRFVPSEDLQAHTYGDGFMH